MRKIYGWLIYWSFDRLYHELAWCYDLVAMAVSRGYWPRWIVAAVPNLAGGPVLELGCGTGYLQLALAREAIPHVGYDASPQMLRQAARRIRRAGFRPRLMHGRAQSLPFTERAFRDVVATFPAPYIVHRETLDEVRRVLRPGGRLLIVDGGRLDGGLYEAAVELAYRATLQVGETDRYAGPLEQAGFTVGVQRIAVGRSSVALISAQRV